MRFLIISLSVLIFALTLSPVKAYNFIDDSGLSPTAGEAGYDLNVEENALERTIARNITLVLSLVGIIFIILIIYAGINWMTAQGNEEKVGQAKKIIINSIIGLIVVIAAYAISYFLLEFILGVTWDNSSSDIPG